MSFDMDQMSEDLLDSPVYSEASPPLDLENADVLVSPVYSEASPLLNLENGDEDWPELATRRRARESEDEEDERGGPSKRAKYDHLVDAYTTLLMVEDERDHYKALYYRILERVADSDAAARLAHGRVVMLERQLVNAHLELRRTRAVREPSVDMLVGSETE